MTGFIDPLDSDHPEPAPGGTDPAQLETLRELVLRAHPNVVPELVTGTTIDDLLASIEPASAAYDALATRFASPQPVPEPVQVPAGTVSPGVIDLDLLSPSEKLRRGLAGARK